MKIARPKNMLPGVPGGFLPARPNERADARIVVLVLIVFLLGLGIGALWIYRASAPRTAEARDDGLDQPGEVALSKSTLTTLKNLKSPVRVTFYSLLGDADVRESTSPFVSRVGQLLSAFERAADGKLQVTQHVAVSEEAMRSAAKDGVTPFNIEKGEACYLGIVVGQGERTEAIQRLAPEWEQALEFDLTRAIQRVTKPEQRQPSPAETVRINPATTDEVKRLIPNYGSVSIEQGTAILREAARKEFTEAATALQAQLKEAQDRFTQLTQSGGTEAEQQAALKHFQAVQAEQTEKLNEIAARLHERIAALEKMRGEAE